MLGMMHIRTHTSSPLCDAFIRTMMFFLVTLRFGIPPVPIIYSQKERSHDEPDKQADQDVTPLSS